MYQQIDEVDIGNSLGSALTNCLLVATKPKCLNILVNLLFTLDKMMVRLLFLTMNVMQSVLNILCLHVSYENKIRQSTPLPRCIDWKQLKINFGLRLRKKTTFTS